MYDELGGMEICASVRTAPPPTKESKKKKDGQGCEGRACVCVFSSPVKRQEEKGRTTGLVRLPVSQLPQKHDNPLKTGTDPAGVRAPIVFRGLF